MKGLIGVLLFGVCLSGCSPRFYEIPVTNGKLAGILPMVDGRVQYGFSEAVPGVSAQDIFTRIRRYAALSIDQTGSVISQSDAATKEIIVLASLEKGVYPVPGLSPYVSDRPLMALIVQAKDGGIRLTMGNFRISTTPVGKAVTGKDYRPIEYETDAYPDTYKAQFRDIHKQVNELAKKLVGVAATPE